MLKFLPDPGHNVSSWIAASQASLIHITLCEEIYESENILALMEQAISAQAFQMCHEMVSWEYCLLCSLSTSAEIAVYIYRQMKSLLLILSSTLKWF